MTALIAIGVLVAVVFLIRALLRPPAPVEFPSTELEPGPMHWAPGPDAPLAFPVEPRRRAVLAALKNGWTMAIVYFDDEGNRTERTIFPLQMRGENLVRAACRLRQENRTFRLDRMQSIEVHAARRDAQDRYRVQG